MKATEAGEQIAFIQWARNNGILALHIPNGEYRDKRTASRLKLMGVVAGVPDVFVPALHAFIEFKSEKGRLSAAQREMISTLEQAGYQVALCRSAQEAVDFVKALMEKIENP